MNKTRPYSAFFCFVCHLVLIEIKEISQITDIGKSQFKRSILRRNHNLAKFSKKNGRRLGFIETLNSPRTISSHLSLPTLIQHFGLNRKLVLSLGQESGGRGGGGLVGAAIFADSHTDPNI